MARKGAALATILGLLLAAPRAGAVPPPATPDDVRGIEEPRSAGARLLEKWPTS